LYVRFTVEGSRVSRENTDLMQVTYSSIKNTLSCAGIYLTNYKMYSDDRYWLYR